MCYLKMINNLMHRNNTHTVTKAKTTVTHDKSSCLTLNDRFFIVWTAFLKIAFLDAFWGSDKVWKEREDMTTHPDSLPVGIPLNSIGFSFLFFYSYYFFQSLKWQYFTQNSVDIEFPDPIFISIMYLWVSIYWV